MLTARVDTIDVVVGLEAGADDYVQEAVRGARARRPRSGRAPPRRPPAGRGADRLDLGPLAIDLAGRTVARDGPAIALTRTEFDLLAELARHAGQVLTRGRAARPRLGLRLLGDSRLVDVAIQRLRAKVETDPADPELVLTVRGAGYKAAR
jgi:two-component system response regulator MtrA